MALTLLDNAKRFGRYRLLGHIADGGMASVFLAQFQADHHFTKYVAVKVVHPKLVSDERFERMFLSEARLAARIDHPHVAQVFDCGAVDDQCYLAMEYLSGQNLHVLIKRCSEIGARMSRRIIARIIADTAHGLHAAHELKGEDGELIGLVHRDISPQNIFVLYSGATKIMDFGVAAATNRESEEELTLAGEVKGKFAYMAPEQLLQNGVDRRADIFSLGVVLWEAICGVRLFKRRTDAETAMAIVKDTVEPPTAVYGEAEEELDRIVLKAVARDREDRYETARDLAEDLERYIASSNEPTGAGQVSRFIQSVFPGWEDEHSTTLKSASRLVESLVQEEEISARRVISSARAESQAARERVHGSGGWLRGLWVAAVTVALVAGFVLYLEGRGPSGRDIASPEELPAPAAASAVRVGPLEDGEEESLEEVDVEEATLDDQTAIGSEGSGALPEDSDALDVAMTNAAAQWRPRRSARRSMRSESAPEPAEAAPAEVAQPPEDRRPVRAPERDTERPARTPRPITDFE